MKINDTIIIEVVSVLGSNIEKLRNKKKLTQEELANRIGTGPKTVSNWEKGKAFPSMEMLLELYEVLDTDINKLIGKDENIKSKYSKEEKKDKIMHILFTAGLMLIPVIYGIWCICYYKDILDHKYLINNNLITLKDSKYAFDTCLNAYFEGIVAYIVFMITNYVIYKLKRSKILFAAILIEMALFIGSVSTLV